MMTARSSCCDNIAVDGAISLSLSHSAFHQICSQLIKFMQKLILKYVN